MMTVTFFQMSSGAEPVRDYLDTLPAAEAAEVAEALVALETYGLAGANVTTRHIDGKLWEIKVSAQRVFYVVVTGPTMVLLHAYKKQGQKAPTREIDTAKRRMKEYLR